jgi:regulator of sigma E protease
MTENEAKPQQDLIEQEDAPKNDLGQLLLFLAIIMIFIFWGADHPKIAKQIILVLLGFGGIVIIHELGHFIVAKLGGINVQAFSIGFPPVVLGIRKLKKGWRIRFLPKPGEEVRLREGDNETEYQIGLIPFGGFVKMLGQSDTGAADASDDPRSYANRPIWIRVCVVSAGVVFNAIGAAVIFMILFMNGIKLPPGEVGSVEYNSPAYDAGIRAGDEIIAVNGDDFVDFTTVQLAPLLSSPGEPIEFKVRHPDQSVETVDVIAETPAGSPPGMRYVGINQTESLKIDDRNADIPEYVADLEKIGLRPGDEIKAVENQSVDSYQEFHRIISNTIKPAVTVRVSRQWPIEPDNKQRTMATTTLPLQIRPIVENFRKEFDLANFASLVPQLRVEDVSKPSRVERMKNWFRETILRKEPEPTLQDKLKPGDVLLQVGPVTYPTYEELRKVTEDYKDKELPVTVLRTDEQGKTQKIRVTVMPKTDYVSKRVIIGFEAGLDMDSPVVAEVLLPASQLPAEKPAIPAGAKITAIAGQPVRNFYDIASVLQENAGRTVTVDYEFEGEIAETSLTVPKHEPIHAEAGLAVNLSSVLAEYTKLYEADNPVEAVRMGFKKVWQFIAQNYITLTRLIERELPSSSLMGPVGIVSVSYRAAGYSLDRYLYLLGLISTALAVMNLLPLPVLDGGHIVLLLIEKVTGKPLNEKILAPIMYAGLALILALLLWVSYNDVMRLLFG